MNYLLKEHKYSGMTFYICDTRAQAEQKMLERYRYIRDCWMTNSEDIDEYFSNSYAFLESPNSEEGSVEWNIYECKLEDLRV